MFHCLVFHYTKSKSINALPNVKDNVIDIVSIPVSLPIIDMNDANVTLLLVTKSKFKKNEEQPHI